MLASDLFNEYISRYPVYRELSFSFKLTSPEIGGMNKQQVPWHFAGLKRRSWILPKCPGYGNFH